MKKVLIVDSDPASSPDGLATDAAVFTEPLAAAYQIVRQIRFDSPDKVVVLGDGRLGQLIEERTGVAVDLVHLMFVARSLERVGDLESLNDDADKDDPSSDRPVNNRSYTKEKRR